MIKGQETPTQSQTAKTPADIVIVPSKFLRTKAETVVQPSYEEFALIESMFEVMAAANGAGLSANQIGVNKRIIVLDIPNTSSSDNIQNDIQTSGRYAFINPVVVDVGNAKVIREEGCLSIPGFYAGIERPSYVTVEGLDEHGNKICLKATGLLAAAIQHEIDHLDGKLIIDKVSRLKRDIVIRKLKKFSRTGKMIVKVHGAPSL